MPHSWLKISVEIIISTIFGMEMDAGDLRLSGHKETLEVRPKTKDN
jgi:hypothetical protein